MPTSGLDGEEKMTEVDSPGAGSCPTTDKRVEHILRPIRPLLARVAVAAGDEMRSAGVIDLGAVSGPEWEQLVRQGESGQGDSSSRGNRIVSAFGRWLQRYRSLGLDLGEGDAQRLYAQQVAHFTFLRALLGRLLPGKGWTTEGGAGRVLDGYCRHFFPGAVFDWLTPPRALMAPVEACVEVLDLGVLSCDLPGYSYEACADRRGRNERGHFLTRPEMIDYVLDRAGYDGPDVVERRLLDPACGSGGFLIHAAARLRRAIVRRLAEGAGASEEGVGSSSGRTGVLPRQLGATKVGREFVDRVRRNLVGFDLDPYACFLSEVNLFIQTVGDLEPLAEGDSPPEPPRFAIHNVNSLELPLKRPLGEDETFRRLDQFDYVVSNPPFVNRGVVALARGYFDQPFYRSILEGDQNSYLLFLRLASHLVAEEGVIAYLVPLNLFGDRSAQRARAMFADRPWGIVSLTRFYSRRQLFPNVLQGVGVFCVQRRRVPAKEGLVHPLERPAEAEETIEVRAGWTVAEVRERVLRLPRSTIAAGVPAGAQPDWRGSWLVTGQRDAYDIWRHVREVTASGGRPRSVATLIAGHLTARKGDGNSTYLRALEASDGSIPLLRAAHLADYGGWRPAAYLDPEVAEPAPESRYYRYRRDVETARKAVRAIAALTRPQTVVLLKEISGLEMRRPVRGTVVERGPNAPLVADDTLLTLATVSPSDSPLAYALFALLTSALGNYLFGLFSTNPHVALNHILRLPLPPDDEPTLSRLSVTARLAVDPRRLPGAVSPDADWRLREQIETIDNLVFDWYGIDSPRWREVILAGQPWGGRA